MKPRTNRPPAGLEGLARLMLDAAEAAQGVADAYRAFAEALLDADFDAQKAALAGWERAMACFRDTMERVEREMPLLVAGVKANLAAGNGTGRGAR